MEIISTTEAPKALGPYSQAVVAGANLYISGQIAIDPATGAMVQDSIEAETEQIFSNIEAILTAANYRFFHVVKVTVFTTDMAYFDAVNKIYAGYFKIDPPARSFVQVAALPKGARLEIEVTAVK